MTENPNQGGYPPGYPPGYGGSAGYGDAPPSPSARRNHMPIYVVLALGGLVLTIVLGVLLINARPGTPTATIVYRLVPPDGRQITDAELDTTVQILQHRLNSAGDVQGSAKKMPPDMVSVRLYGETDVPALSDSLGPQGELFFVLLPRATYGDITAQSTTPLPAKGSVIDPELVKTAQFSGSELDPKGTAAVEDLNNPGHWLVTFAFAGDYANQFATWTGQHINAFLAIVLDGKVLSVPYIRSAITSGKGQISGAFTATEAKWLAAILTYGALPIPLRDVSRPATPSGPPSTSASASASPSACASPTGESETSASAAVASASASAAAVGYALASASPASASAVAAAASASASAAAASAYASASASAAAAAAPVSRSC